MFFNLHRNTVVKFFNVYKMFLVSGFNFSISIVDLKQFRNINEDETCALLKLFNILAMCISEVLKYIQITGNTVKFNVPRFLCQSH